MEKSTEIRHYRAINFTKSLGYKESPRHTELGIGLSTGHSFRSVWDTVRLLTALANPKQRPLYLLRSWQCSANPLGAKKWTVP